MCSRPAFPPWSKKATTLIMNGSRKPVKPTEKKSWQLLTALTSIQNLPAIPSGSSPCTAPSPTSTAVVSAWLKPPNNVNPSLRASFPMRKKITEMLPVSMFSMSPAILSILMISQPTIPMIFQNITNLLILTRIPLPYRVPSQIRKNTSPDWIPHIQATLIWLSNRNLWSLPLHTKCWRSFWLLLLLFLPQQ